MDATEYSRRSAYNDAIKTMTYSEHIEIARILRKHGAPISTNRNGIYFSVDKLAQPVFEELLRFQEFVVNNTAELAKRDGAAASAAIADLK